MDSSCTMVPLRMVLETVPPMGKAVSCTLGHLLFGEREVATDSNIYSLMANGLADLPEALREIF